MHIIFIEVMLNQADKYKQHEDVYMFLVHTEYTSTHTQLDPRISFFFFGTMSWSFCQCPVGQFGVFVLKCCYEFMVFIYVLCRVKGLYQ